MKFTERHFRIFATVNWLAYLAKSNLVYTSLGMVRSSVPQYPPQHHHHSISSSTPTFHLHIHPCSRTNLIKPTDQPSSGDILLPDHRPVRSRRPHGQRWNFGLVHSCPVLATACVGWSCRLVPPSQGYAGRVLDQLERLPHGGHRVSKAEVQKPFRRLAKDHTGLLRPSHSCVG